jgi:protein phosphatase
MNEDSYDYKALSDEFCFAVVCDGMGGHAAGNVASAAAVEIIAERIFAAHKENPEAEEFSDLLAEAIRDANKEIFEEGMSNESLLGMGTTVVAVIVKGGTAHISNVGDSRVYCVNEKGIEQLTHDHSYVQTLVDTGHISKEEALTHPKRNMITRALGVDASVQVDYMAFSFAKNDALLLCSDGLTNFVSDATIADVFRECLENDAFETYADRLVALANENGGGDNITAVVILNDEQGAGSV